MSVVVLMSCMNQNDFSIVEKSKIHSDAIIINQTNEEIVKVKEYDFGKVMMISTTERGLSRSRNMALKHATADICIICDDDEILSEGYVQLVENAFAETDADVLVFNIKSLNEKARPQEPYFKKIKKINKYKSFSSVHVTFRRKLIETHNLKYNIYFGSGSGYYSMAEDSLFFSELHKCSNKIFTYPAIIAELNVYGSTWFKGFDKKYFYDTGAFLHAWKPWMAHIFKWYYIIKLKKRTDLTIFQMLFQLNSGIKGYKNKKFYMD